MGQYWIPVNLDKKESLDPHRLATGLKLWEQLVNGAIPGPMAAVLVLCAAMPESRGGGDLEAVPDVVGRWAGDRIAWVGDYAEDTDLAPEHHAGSVYRWARDGENGWADITHLVAPVLERECHGRYEGTGWRDWLSDDRTIRERPATSIDVVVGSQGANFDERTQGGA